jgi:hypothetical protein
MPQPIYSRGRIPQYPLDRRLGGPKSQSGRYGEVKILDLTGTRTPTLSRPARSQTLYIPSAIYRLVDKTTHILEIITSINISEEPTSLF